MKRTAIALAVAAAAVASPAALAKGPSEAALSGPGLDRSIIVTGFGEPGSPTALGQIVDGGGFFAAVFGQTPDPMLASAPTGDLGPRFKIRFTVPGPAKASTIVQDVFPYATPRPVTYTAPGQPYWEGGRTRGGWFSGTPALREALITAGLPAKAPGDASQWPWTLTGTVFAAVALAGAPALALARRFRRNARGEARVAPTRTP